MPKPFASARVIEWKEAWESREVEPVVAMYAESAKHASGMVASLWPELGRNVLHGRDEIRAYAVRGIQRLTTMRFELLTVTESGGRAAVEYHRHSNLDPANPKHVLELIEWEPGGLISSVRVFHF
ncbi:MAG: nuclear transport factor 2 family protein [Candidatus Binataceae bacterium]